MLKDIVIGDIDNLKQKISDVSIDDAMLQLTRQEIEYRLDVFRAAIVPIKNYYMCIK